MRKHIFGILQRVGRSFMLPIALLPVAGLFLGIGSSFTNTTMLSAYHLTDLIGPGTIIYSFLSLLNSAGSVIFNNLPILFALGVAIGMAKNEKAVAALSSMVAFLIMHSTIGQLIAINGRTESLLTGAVADVVGITSLQMGVFGGIIVGLGVAALHNRFYKIELPQVFSFFGGTRFVPIISAIVYLGVGILMYYVWPPVQQLINGAGQLVLRSGYGGTFLYGLLERALIPFGLHHVFYIPFWQTSVGGSALVNGQLVEGAQNIFFAELATPGISHFNVEATRFMSGKFPLMIFGLPGAALAMYTCARSERKKAVGSLLLSAAITSIITGITEPLEFAFLFVAPVLYGIHCIFAGLAYMLMHIFNVGIGMTFSGGLIDLTLFGILQGNAKTNWLYVIPVGLVYFAVYFVVFRFMILKFDYQTPGREKNVTDQELAAGNPEQGGHAESRSAGIVQGLGGIDNISDLDCCATRLRVTVLDPALIDKACLTSTGAAAVIVSGSGVQIVYGPKVTLILSELEDYMHQPAQGNISTDNSADSNSGVQSADTEIKTDALTDIVYAPCDGTVIPLRDVEDGVFSEGFIGEGTAIQPSGGTFYAPFDATVAMVFDTCHAIVLHSPKDTELIIHIGLDTVQLKGAHFDVFVKDGQQVKKGEKLIHADLESISKAGYRTVTPIVVTAAGGAESIIPIQEGPVKTGDAILKVSYRN
ncbi:MAG: glucose PTS transporter subunit IIA [Coprococcus sp.]